jgi:hypothetical protein
VGVSEQKGKGAVKRARDIQRRRGRKVVTQKSAFWPCRQSMADLSRLGNNSTLLWILWGECTTAAVDAIICCVFDGILWNSLWCVWITMR